MPSRTVDRPATVWWIRRPGAGRQRPASSRSTRTMPDAMSQRRVALDVDQRREHVRRRCGRCAVSSVDLDGHRRRPRPAGAGTTVRARDPRTGSRSAGSARGSRGRGRPPSGSATASNVGRRPHAAARVGLAGCGPTRVSADPAATRMAPSGSAGSSSTNPTVTARLRRSGRRASRSGRTGPTRRGRPPSCRGGSGQDRCRQLVADSSGSGDSDASGDSDGPGDPGRLGGARWTARPRQTARPTARAREPATRSGRRSRGCEAAADAEPPTAAADGALDRVGPSVQPAPVVGGRAGRDDRDQGRGGERPGESPRRSAVDESRGSSVQRLRCQDLPSVWVDGA